MLGEFPMGRVVEEATVLTIVEYGVFVPLRDRLEALVSSENGAEPRDGKL